MSVTYRYSYVYNGNTYSDSWSVRRAIENNENKRFGPEPSDADHEAQKQARVTFWAGHGVEYKEQEVIIPDPDPQEVLENARVSKLQSLESWFNSYRASNKTFIISSLGFKSNSNVTAFNNVDGLIGLASVKEFAPEGTIAFMDFEDKPHMLRHDDLVRLKNEISAAASMAYQVKWEYREKILAAKSEIELNEIVFEIQPFDFGSKAMI